MELKVPNEKIGFSEQTLANLKTQKKLHQYDKFCIIQHLVNDEYLPEDLQTPIGQRMPESLNISEKYIDSLIELLLKDVTTDNENLNSLLSLILKQFRIQQSLIDSNYEHIESLYQITKKLRTIDTGNYTEYTEKKSKKMTFNLKPTLFEDFKNIVKNKNENVNNVLNLLIEQYVIANNDVLDIQTENIENPQNQDNQNQDNQDVQLSINIDETNTNESIFKGIQV